MGRHGNTEASYNYDAYGVVYGRGAAERHIEVIPGRPSAFKRGTDYLYTGKRQDAATGLYDYGFRDYAPRLARFTTVDPIKDGRNWYAYVGADPVNLVDPLGLASAEDGANPQLVPWTVGPTGGQSVDLATGMGAGPTVQIPPPGRDPSRPPGPGWEWRGKPGSEPGDADGSWYNPGTGESLHPDLEHPDGIEPHWDYKPGRNEKKIRIDPDTGQPIDPETTRRIEPPVDPDPNVLVRVGLGAVGVVIIIVDIVTIPTGEGAIGVGLIGKAIGAY